MNPSTNTPSEDEELYAPVDKWSKSTGFLPVIAGSNPAGSTQYPFALGKKGEPLRWKQ